MHHLKQGVSGVSIDYERIRFTGPTLSNHLFLLYQDFFQTHTVPENLKTRVILPLFKSKGVKTNNKDNYRGIKMFPILCKIYEMILLSRLEVFAKPAFTVLETINHMLEWGCKIFSCFLDVSKAFDTVWIDDLLNKLFID